jgi:hypothetical protein
MKNSTWRRIKDVWGVVRQFLSLRSLLDLIGWKARVVAGLMFVASTLWSRLAGLPGPLQLLIGLSCAALLLICLVFVRVWKLIATAPSHIDEKGDYESLSKGPSKVSDGPELVIDYVYAEDSKDHHDADAPLVLRNISRTAHAYNVEVLPLKTDEGSVLFEPSLISYIEAQGLASAFANITDGGPLSPGRRLPLFLYRSYKDINVEELFATKVFTLSVRYKGTTSTVFQTDCELRFRPWKKEISIGRTERRIAPMLRTPVDLALRTRSARENLQHLCDRYTAASQFCQFPLSKRWRPWKGKLDFTQDIRDGLEWTQALTALLVDVNDVFNAANRQPDFAGLAISGYLTEFLELPYAECLDALWKLEEKIKSL